MKIGDFYISRKLLLSLFGVVTAIVAHYAEIPAEIWISIEAFVVTLIGSIAVEDAGAKSSNVTVVPYVEEE